MSQMNPVDRRMKYPYTYTAKLMSFPFAHYYKHAWVAKYFVFGFLLTLPVMAKITTAVNNPENVAKWKEIRRKQFSGEH
ncbi:uncharacterized protein roh [Venturia canescens]|uniref:uncharacterized protein roh n=1 Tax=Venturia canescens TaxID=32260 RepID=UPI001C9C627C|nr:uncharacterized protein LOC122408654 [Venturia canescens]